MAFKANWKVGPEEPPKVPFYPIFFRAVNMTRNMSNQKVRVLKRD